MRNGEVLKVFRDGSRIGYTRTPNGSYIGRFEFGHYDERPVVWWVGAPRVSLDGSANRWVTRELGLWSEKWEKKEQRA